MTNIKIDKKIFQIPTSWSECTHAQLKSIAAIWGVSFIGDNELYEDVMIERKMIVLRSFLNINKKIFARINAHQMHDLLPSINFIHKKIDYDAQPIQSFNCFFKRFYGPTKGLHTTSFDEFIYADTLFVSISKKKDLTIVFDLVAALYRPKRKDWKQWQNSPDFNGDIREEFNAVKAKQYAKRFKRWMNLYDAMAILYFYWGWRNTHLLKYKTLFPEPEEGQEPKANQYGWIDTRLEISGKKFGDYKNTGKTNWQTIIFDMHRAEEKRIAEEKRREMQRIRNKTKRQYG